MMRIVDVVYAYPTLILIILFAGLLLTAMAQRDASDPGRGNGQSSNWTVIPAGCSSCSWRLAPSTG